MRNSESGNVLFYILIAVALLAALSYAVSSSSRGGGGDLSAQRAALYATEILEYANNINSAVSQLRLRGCKETEVSFANAVIGGYTNNNAPDDYSCHVFNPAGAGVNYQKPLDEILVSSTHYRFAGNMNFNDIGTTCGDESCSELYMNLQPIKKNVCVALNDKLGFGEKGADPLVVDYFERDPAFQGIYSYTRILGTGTEGLISGRQAGCVQENPDHCSGEPDCYTFYKILLAR